MIDALTVADDLPRIVRVDDLVIGRRESDEGVTPSRRPIANDQRDVVEQRRESVRLLPLRLGRPLLHHLASLLPARSAHLTGFRRLRQT